MREKTIQVILGHSNVATTSGYYIKTASAAAVAAEAEAQHGLLELGNGWTTEPNAAEVTRAIN